MSAHPPVEPSEASTADVVRVHPGFAGGQVVVPGDKSLSHRALLLSGLVGDPVAVAGLAGSGDVAATARCVRTLGGAVGLVADADGNLAGTVTGPLREPDDVLDCGNAGTGMRLLAGVVAGMPGLAVLTGDASLRRRPMDRVVAPLRALGARVDARDGDRRPPLVVRGGALVGTTWDSPVASAQVKSCVLLAGLAAEGPTTVASPARSRDHTERLLAHLGVHVDVEARDDGAEVVTVHPGPLRGDRVDVSGDPSSAAFWAVAGAIGGAPVRLPGLCANPRRTGMVDVLRQLGADVELAEPRRVCGEPVADLVVAGGRLDGGAVVEGAAVVDALDELPVLAVAGAVAAHGLVVRDAAELRVKESDRLDGIARALDALGLRVDVHDDGFTVPGGQQVPGGGRVDADGDHRIAMTAAVGATVAAAPVDVAGFASVATSYPGFLDHLVALGGRAEVLATAGAST